MDMTTNAPLSWVDGSTEDGCTCPPNEGKIAGGCRSAPIRTQGQARHQMKQKPDVAVRVPHVIALERKLI